MTEQALWARLSHAAPWDWAVRVENRVGPGTPDINFVLERRGGWMELKVSPRTHPSCHPLQGAFRPAQYAWHARARKSGVFTCVLLFAKKQAILLPHTLDLPLLTRMTLAELQSVAVWVGGNTSRGRFVGLREKLEQQTDETICMAGTCTARQPSA